MDYVTLYLITATVALLFINSLIVIFNMATTVNVNSSDVLEDGGKINLTNISVKNPFSLSVGTVSAAVLALTLYISWVFNYSYSFFYAGGQGNSSFSFDIVSANQGSLSYLFFSFLLVMLTFIVIISIPPYQLKESSILVMLSTAGILLMAASTNFISFYLAIELISLSSYILASTTLTNETADGNLPSGENTNSKINHEASPIVAGLKYFLLSALSSGLLVLGISLIYMATGELDLNSLARIISTSYLEHHEVSCSLGMCLVVAFVLFKLGASPFHYWVADVYSQVSIFVNYYLIVVGKLGMLFALMKLSFGMVFPLVQNLILVASILSLLVGSFAGLVQTKLRRLMAFSSINHVGYIALAYSFSFVETEIPLELTSGTDGTLPNLTYLSNSISNSSLASLWLYIAIYSLSTVSFFAILSLSNQAHWRPKGSQDGIYPSQDYPKSYLAESLARLKDETKFHNFYINMSLTITILSLAGVPPLAGFIAKIAIFWQVLDSGNWVAATIAVLCSVVAAVYYLRIISLLFFFPSSNSNKKDSLALAEKSAAGAEGYDKNDKPSNNLSSPSITYLKALIIASITVILVVYPILNPSFIYLYFHSF